MVGSWLRTTQAWCQQLCDKETLDHGIIYFQPRYAALPEASQIREVILPANGIADAFAQTREWFEARGLRCLRWAPAEGQRIESWEQHLQNQGFQRHDYQVMQLARWVESAPREGIRVIPARAVRKFLADAIRNGEPSTAGHVELLVQAFDERMDDAQLDMFVAVAGAQAVGAGGLYQVGDVARVVSPLVASGPEANRVEGALFSAILGLARRLALRTILVAVEKDDSDARERLESRGFVMAGGFSEFDWVG